MVGTLRILTLGHYQVDWRSEEEAPWRTITNPAWQERALRALIACLVSQQARTCKRGDLLEALWPGLNTRAANAYLERTAGLVNQLLNPGGKEDRSYPFLRINKEHFSLAGPEQLWLDADAFEELLQEASVQEDGRVRERLLQHAVRLYHGDFVPEEGRIEYILKRRKTLHRRWMKAQLSLAHLRKEHGDLEEALELLERLITLDPTWEAAIQLLMDTQRQCGHIEEVRQPYDRLTQALRHDDGAAPLAKTRTLNEATQFSLSAAQQRQQGERTSRTLIEREKELNTLLSLLNATEEQHAGQCILLLGRVGIGKTRLVEEVGLEAQRRGWMIIWSRVYPQEGAISYRLWHEVLRKMGEDGMGATLSQRQSAQSLHRGIPLLIAEGETLRIWEGVEARLVEVSERIPLLIVLDDLHWSDAASCHLLEYLARRLQEHRILLVGTCRDDAMSRDHAMRSVLTHLHEEDSALLLPIAPLSSEGTRSLVRSLSSLSDALVNQIVHYAGGNPLFAEELTEAEAKQDVFFFPPTTTGAPDFPSFLDLSPRLTSVLELLLYRLSPHCQHLLGKALSLGASFTLHDVFTLEKATIGTMSVIDEESVTEALSEALQEGILAQERAGKNPTYQVVFPLLADYLSQRLSAGRRLFYQRVAVRIRQEQGAR